MCLLSSLNLDPKFPNNLNHNFFFLFPMLPLVLFTFTGPDKLLASFLSFHIIAPAQKWNQPTFPKETLGKRDFQCSTMGYGFILGAFPFAYLSLHVFLPPSPLFWDSMAGGKHGLNLLESRIYCLIWGSQITDSTSSSLSFATSDWTLCSLL